MAAGNTYVALATNTLSSAAASVTFSSISGAYTDLVLVFTASAALSNTYSVQLRFNSDSGSNYSDTRVYGNGTTATSNRDSSQTEMYPTNITGTIGTFTNQIMNYSNTTTYKTILTRGVSADYAAWANVGLWRSTAAITSIYLNVSGGNFASGSTFQLFGIAAA